MFLLYSFFLSWRAVANVAFVFAFVPLFQEDPISLCTVLLKDSFVIHQNSKLVSYNVQTMKVFVSFRLMLLFFFFSLSVLYCFLHGKKVISGLCLVVRVGPYEWFITQFSHFLNKWFNHCALNTYTQGFVCFFLLAGPSTVVFKIWFVEFYVWEPYILQEVAEKSDLSDLCSLYRHWHFHL